MQHIGRSGLMVIGLLLVLATGFAFRAELGMLLFTRVVEHRLSQSVPATLPDGLHVFLCGTGSPMPDNRRAGPCIGVLAGQRAYVVDAGSGGPRQLARMGFPIGALEG